MISRFYNYLQGVRSNLWFTPALFSLVFFAITLTSYFLETKYLSENFNLPSLFFDIGVEDAKDISLSLLGSTITLATLAISVTMVALSLAASQLGPRLIKVFMADKRTKALIGVFFGVVFACFTLTLILHTSNEAEYKYQITINLVFMFCFIDLFVLLAFINHVAKSCIADNVVLDVKRELESAIRRLAENAPKVNKKSCPKKKDWEAHFEDNTASLYFEDCGYIQNVDYDKIVKIAKDKSLYINVLHEAGDYIFKGQECLKISPENMLEDDTREALKNAFIIGNVRTATQDLEYSVRHMVEIAIRALSPGINDSFTAANVVDHLSGALSILLRQDFRVEWKSCPNEETFIHIKSKSEEEILISAFDKIRDSASNTPFVLQKTVDNLSILLTLSDEAEQKKTIKSQIKLLKDNLK